MNIVLLFIIALLLVLLGWREYDRKSAEKRHKERMAQLLNRCHSAERERDSLEARLEAKYAHVDSLRQEKLDDAYRQVAKIQQTNDFLRTMNAKMVSLDQRRRGING